MPISYNGPVVVICEGPADAKLIKRLIEREQLNLNGFYIHEARGYQNFGTVVTGIAGSSNRMNLRRLVIVGDNDTDPAGRFDNACNALQREGFPIPPEPSQITAGDPSTAIFLIPQAGVIGALETLLVAALLEGHPEVEECLRRLEECPTGCGGWNDVKKSKMRFQAAVAVTCADDPSAGAAHIWSKAYNPVNAASTAFNELATFLVAVSVIP